MMIDPTVINLNASSSGILSQKVFKRLIHLNKSLAENPTNFLKRVVPSLLWKSRRSLAKYLGTKPEEILLTVNVSESINLVASSLAIERGSEILMSNSEYTPMKWCWERAANRLDLSIRYFSIPSKIKCSSEIVKLLISQIRPETRVLFFSHIISSTGLILPAKELCEVARRRNIITVIDGAQAPGLVKLDIPKIQCDFYAGSGNKWLLAPTGSGFLYISNRLKLQLNPSIVSWGFKDLCLNKTSNERNEFGSTPEFRRIECQGTRNIIPRLVFPEAIKYLEEIGLENIKARIKYLTTYLRIHFESILKLSLVSPRNLDLSFGISSFYLPENIPFSELKEDLWSDYKIEISFDLTNRLPLIRVSTHFYNTIDEIDFLVESLNVLLNKFKHSEYNF